MESSSFSNIVIVWFRRDLRLFDNAALFYALKSGLKVLPIFIFDSFILEKLEDKSDPRVHFIHQQIQKINNALLQFNSGIKTFYGNPIDCFQTLKQEFPNISSIYCNHDYELSAIKRDIFIADWAIENGISFHSYKDQVIFEKDEVVKDDQKPYTVFTPYSRKWKAKLNEFYTKSYPCEKYYSNFLHVQNNKIHSLNEIGFTENEKIAFPQNIPSIDIIKKYAEQRDFPAIKGTTRLSLHLRFGTVSIRELTRLALQTSETWLNELIWRDFYMMILYQFPNVTNKSFKPQYDRIVWRNNEQEFKLWCEGKTGYPIVDAGMRELNTTGFMHNRVRMIVASFLTKHLLIDWRWGEAYFAQKLLDFDLSANNGGWQWAAGSGCDAAPYFRVFNPTLQTQKFDPKLEYIKKWVPELNSFNYPQPIVNHEFARKRCLEVYKQGLSEGFQ